MIGYTELDFVNYQGPAINDVSLNHMDEGIKAVSDWADGLLASTGIPSSVKVPKALGADLVALITAAGYTLNPATGTASLDGIADGTTYKRTLAAIATALNASTIVAGTQWGSGNDGNGGQPPAPKPTEGTPAGGANGVGQMLKGVLTSGNTLYHSGANNLTGTWFIYWATSTATIYTMNNFTAAVGSGLIGTISAGEVLYYIATRVA